VSGERALPEQASLRYLKLEAKAQSLLLPLGLPVIFGYVTATSAITSGHPSVLFHVLAYLPPTAPFAMPVLVSLGAASAWQFALSAVISGACTAGLARGAIAVYRTPSSRPAVGSPSAN
jgi:hypothetical protein